MRAAGGRNFDSKRPSSKYSSRTWPPSRLGLTLDQPLSDDPRVAYGTEARELRADGTRWRKPAQRWSVNPDPGGRARTPSAGTSIGAADATTCEANDGSDTHKDTDHVVLAHPGSEGDADRPLVGGGCGLGGDERGGVEPKRTSCHRASGFRRRRSRLQRSSRSRRRCSTPGAATNSRSHGSSLIRSAFRVERTTHCAALRRGDSVHASGHIYRKRRLCSRSRPCRYPISARNLVTRPRRSCWCIEHDHVPNWGSCHARAAITMRPSRLPASSSAPSAATTVLPQREHRDRARPAARPPLREHERCEEQQENESEANPARSGVVFR